MDNAIDLYASFEDGKLIIERKDAQPIAMISRDEVDGECVEVVEFGIYGNAVKAVQALLNCHGQHLEVDGIFGALTQTALIIYQDLVQLPADGVANISVWESLIRR